MTNEALIRQFEKMGARCVIDEGEVSRFAGDNEMGFTINVLQDKDGEYFRIVRSKDSADLQTLQVLPDKKHLVLMAKEEKPRHENPSASKMLCGHDERHWFVAGVGSHVTTVADAMRALDPKQETPTKDLGKHKTDDFIRQGEWFFYPAPDFKPDPNLIHRNEPIRMPGRTEHICEELYRDPGETVWVVDGQIYKKAAYERLRKEKGQAWLNTRFVRQETSVRAMYARGKISHPDHKTRILNGWHKIEGAAGARIASSTVLYLD